MRNYLMLALGTLAVVRAFMSDVCPTVTIIGHDGDPLIVNKSDYDADQAEGGAKSMTLHKTQHGAASGGTPTAYPPGVQPTAAPSAPNFNSGDQTPDVIDPAKNAAAPTAPSPNSLLVSKGGTEKKPVFTIVDGNGAPVVHGLINADGYATEKEAWDAVVAVQAAGGNHPSPAPAT